MINRSKNERENIENESDRPLNRALDAAQAVPLKAVAESIRLRFPEPPRMVMQRTDMRKIQYSVERRRYNFAAETLGTTSVGEVGRATFDYFYRNQVEDD
jgi:hypothetical protein